MRIKESLLGHIAKMICGDAPFNDNFPYRSSSYLTAFFHDLYLDYTHDGSTRYWWVSECLKTENRKAKEDDSLLPEGIVKIIEHLVSPEHFVGNEFDQAKAVNKLNEVLKIQGMNITLKEPTNSPILQYLNEDYISEPRAGLGPKQVITFSPTVFNVPKGPVDQNLAGVMMPFASNFDLVYQAIQSSCYSVNLKCKRVDGMWENSEIIQDIFELIFFSRVVIVDFSQKNPNVMYETGIAHTLGKIVVPITQSIDDIPFDLRHHRVLKYYPNSEGLKKLTAELKERLSTITGKPIIPF